MPRFEIKIGPEDFEDRSNEEPNDPLSGGLSGKRFAAEKDVQALVVKSFLFLIIAALIAGFGVSVTLGSWTPITSVWLIVAAPLGVLFDRYVGKPHDQIRAA